MRPQILSIESETFLDMRQKFDALLNLAMNKMQALRVYEATVTAKVKIQSDEVTEPGGEISWRPEFKCQVSVGLPVKGKLDASAPVGLKMIRNPHGDGYIIATEQYTFMDMLEEQDENNSEREESAKPAGDLGGKEAGAV